MRRRAVLAVAAAALPAGGCAGGHGDPVAAARGRAIFARSCAGCHTLVGRETGSDGGDLARTGLGAAGFARWTRIMPTRPPLGASDVAAVSEYVLTVARGLSSAPHPGDLEWRPWRRPPRPEQSPPRAPAAPTATSG